MNWDEIRKEYESSDITLKALAEKFSLKDSTIRSRKNREKWQRNKNATQRKNVATKKEKVASDELTDKQAAFVKEYLIDLNATQAAIRAGYSSKNADKIGSELLRKTRVSEAIQKAKDKRSKRLEITQDRVLKELAKVGFADIKEYLSFKTDLTTIGYDSKGERIVDYAHVVQLRDSEEIDGAVVSEVSLKDGALKFKLHDKMKALNDLGRHLGMFNDNLNIGNKDDKPFETKQHNDLSKLTVKELKELESILSKAAGTQ
jgi:phage terminase small subunit